MMRKIVISGLGLLVSSLIVVNCWAKVEVTNLPQPQVTAATPLDRIVVVVNDSVITESQVKAAMMAAKHQLAASKTPLPNTADLRKQVINNLIYQAIQQQMVKRAHITVSSAEVTSAIGSIAKRNNMTLAQLRAELQSQGVSYAKYRQQIQKQMQFTRLQQAAIGQDINVTDQEVTDYLHSSSHQADNANIEYKVADILIPTPDDPSPAQVEQAKAKAEKIIQSIKRGANFNQIAAAQSSGQQALQGGDLGWRKLAELPTIFADQVKAMQKGQVAGPLQAPNGFHIIKLTATRASGKKLTRDQVRNLLYQRKFAERLQIWLKKIRDEAYVKFE